MKLIFHIGAGKTGSSSIQKTLRGSEALLLENGVSYMGLMFDKGAPKLYPWQDSSQIEQFHALSPEETQEKLLNLLQQTVKELEPKNIHTLILSNESFFGRMHKTMPALKEFEKSGHEIQIVAYIRRHDAWARSAYIQWGLKHKTSRGKLQPFSQWIKKRMPNFSKGVNEVLDEFPDSFLIRNVDAVRDAVADFLSILGLGHCYIEQARENESPGNEELIMRALFNGKFHEQVLPKRFDHVVGKNLNFSLTPSEYLDSLLPSDQDIQEVVDASRKDRDELNKLLAIQGQEFIKKTPLAEKSYQIDTERLTMALCDIVLRQSLQIRRLEKSLEKK